VAAALVTLVVVRVPVGLLNRRRETRADVEGARLTRDAEAMASGLDAVYRYSDNYRSLVFGQQPWRTLLWPLSWRPPSHPPREKRIASLRLLGGSAETATPRSTP
jgi:Zn-dependent protease with chaperone function